MTSVPLGWRSASIVEIAGGTPSDVVIGPFGSNLKVSDYRDSGVPLVFVKNVRTKNFTENLRYVSPEKAHQLRAHQVLPGDVLVTKMGDPPGDAAVYRSSEPGIVTADCIRIRVASDVVPEFAAYAFETEAVRRQMEGITRGVAQRKVSLARFRESIRLPIPPLGEQQRIVEILEDHLSRLDAAQDYLKRVLAKGASARGAVFQSAISQGARTEPGDVQALYYERSRRFPQGMKRGRPNPASAADVEVPWKGRWPTVSLEEATDPVRTISYGILKPGPNLEGGVPYVRVLNMRHDRLAVDDLHYTSSEISHQYSRASLQPDDVLVSIRGTYGRVVVVPPELRGANITQDTARLGVLPQLLPSFAALVLRSPWAQAHMKRVARGVAVKGVNIADLRRLPMPLPSLAEQARLTSWADALVSDVDKATLSAQDSLRRASTLRRALLAAAFSGRLIGRPSDVPRLEECVDV